MENTANPLVWVEMLCELVEQISRERLTNNLPDCVKVDIQYGGFYLECKSTGKHFHYYSLKTPFQLEQV